MFESSTAKQLAGACGGMAIAGLIYVAYGYVDLANIKGYLVQPGQNISENAGQISTNVKTLDGTSFERLARRAAAVEAALQGTSSSAAPQTALNQNAEARKIARQGATDTAAANANPTTYANTNTMVSEYDRLALRAANTAQALESGHAGAPLYQPNMQVIQVPVPSEPQVIIKEVKVPVPSEPQVIIKEVKVPVPSEPKTIIKEVRVPVPSEPKTIIKEVQVPVPGPTRYVQVEAPVYGKNLPSSGLGLNLLLLASFLGAAAVVRPDLRKQLVASFVRAS